MAGRYILCRLQNVNKIQKFPVSTYINKHGNREVVGYGLNGEPSYLDCVWRPMPAIRFKETTPDIQVLDIFFTKKLLNDVQSV